MIFLFRHGKTPLREIGNNEKLIMSSFNISGRDAEANDQLQLFRAGFTANALGLGYDAGDIDVIIAATGGFNTALAASLAAKEAAKGAVVSKDNARADAETTVRKYVQQIKVNVAATPAILSSMGITPGETVSGPLVPPITLTAKPNSDGTCFLRWKRNGNSSTTVFVIESMIGTAGNWVWQANVQGLRYTDFGAIAGQHKSYRVRAQRAGETSAPCSSVTIYNVGGESEVFLAA